MTEDREPWTLPIEPDVHNGPSLCIDGDGAIYVNGQPVTDEEPDTDRRVCAVCCKPYQPHGFDGLGECPSCADLGLKS